MNERINVTNLKINDMNVELHLNISLQDFIIYKRLI